MGMIFFIDGQSQENKTEIVNIKVQFTASNVLFLIFD